MRPLLEPTTRTEPVAVSISGVPIPGVLTERSREPASSMPISEPLVGQEAAICMPLASAAPSIVKSLAASGVRNRASSDDRSSRLENPTFCPAAIDPIRPRKSIGVASTFCLPGEIPWQAETMAWQVVQATPAHSSPSAGGIILELDAVNKSSARPGALASTPPVEQIAGTATAADAATTRLPVGVNTIATARRGASRANRREANRLQLSFVDQLSTISSVSAATARADPPMGAKCAPGDCRLPAHAHTRSDPEASSREKSTDTSLITSVWPGTSGMLPPSLKGHLSLAATSARNWQWTSTNLLGETATSTGLSGCQAMSLHAPPMSVPPMRAALSPVPSGSCCA
eukprot:scaffold141981_cov31-Tisochrysis_lutea.AAC.4